MPPPIDGSSFLRRCSERLERRYRRVRLRSVGVRALDVEGRREPCALAGGDEAQRFIVRRRDRNLLAFPCTVVVEEKVQVWEDTGQAATKLLLLDCQPSAP